MTKTYETKNLIIYWKPELCQHSGKCVHGAPEVFDPKRKSWIIPENGQDKEIMQVIDECPSKALSYQLK